MTDSLDAMNQRSHMLKDVIDGFNLSRSADGYSTNTLNIYNQHFRQLLNFIGNVEIESVTPENLQSFMVYLKDEYKTRSGTPYSAKSRANAWCALRSLWGWADKLYQCGRPDLTINEPETPEQAIIPFTEDEWNALLAACVYTVEAVTHGRRSFVMSRFSALRDEAILRLLLDTGMRADELCRMRVKDVDFKNNSIWLPAFGSGRKSKGRPVMIGKSTWAVLYKYLQSEERKPDSYVFYSRKQIPLSRFTLAHMLTRLGKRAGVKNVHAHRFRHTFAIEYLRGGGDVFTLKMLLGHTTLKMVNKYLEISQSDIATAHRRASPVDRWRK